MYYQHVKGAVPKVVQNDILPPHIAVSVYFRDLLRRPLRVAHLKGTPKSKRHSIFILINP